MTVSSDIDLYAYLQFYGNTREIDLVDYGVKILGRTPEEMKKILDEMIGTGSVKRIIHDKLDSKMVYISRGSWGIDFTLGVEAYALYLKNVENVTEEARRILEAAQNIAEKRMRRKFPESTERVKRQSLSKNRSIGDKKKYEKEKQRSKKAMQSKHNPTNNLLPT